MGQVVSLQGIQVRKPRKLLQALQLFSEKNIDWSDALIAAEMLVEGRVQIYSYDKDFDRVAGIERIEP